MKTTTQRPPRVREERNEPKQEQQKELLHLARVRRGTWTQFFSARCRDLSLLLAAALLLFLLCVGFVSSLSLWVENHLFW